MTKERIFPPINTEHTKVEVYQNKDGSFEITVSPKKYPDTAIDSWSDDATKEITSIIKSIETGVRNLTVASPKKKESARISPEYAPEIIREELNKIEVVPKHNNFAPDLTNAISEVVRNSVQPYLPPSYLFSIKASSVTVQAALVADDLLKIKFIPNKGADKREKAFHAWPKAAQAETRVLIPALMTTFNLNSYKTERKNNAIASFTISSFPDMAFNQYDLEQVKETIESIVNSKRNIVMETLREQHPKALSKKWIEKAFDKNGMNYPIGKN